MEVESLSSRIKALRKKKGYSQDYLAGCSGLNLRTIQRIESGQTTPLGDTLQRIAQGLDMSMAELMHEPGQDPAVSKADNGYLVILNLSAASVIVFPLMGIVVPFALWMMRRGSDKAVDINGKKILNFQITWLLVFCFFFIALVIGPVFHHRFIPGIGSPEFILLLFLGLYGINLVITAMNTVKAVRRQQSVYWPGFRFLR